ncbi:transcriptional regulator [Olsenella sp. oral taxon 807]|jgi:response regulator with cheY-like receiver domain and winged-helix DNA-binding domain|uniref:response regulator transcription factor n=1 Tax=Olsenella sp. oral taxon 807 TaxID=712411 RepID=UPI00067A34CB|nr:response regulator transcription factor [Olsenella sp. oral taxon 807]AKT47969.1 transcriptional regulator [Olsenella sp. oral taxon 807]
MRVLIVEDDQRLVSYLKKSLEAEGLSVDVAFDGNVALDKALAQSYDVITLDIMLPELNGYRVCQNLRSSGVPTPILMLTAKDGEYDEADALDVGADDFLRKPFSMVVLLARIRALARRGGAAAGKVLCVGDLRLDMASKRVERGGSRIELTPREYALLEYLMLRRGIALTKAQLLEHVWGARFMGSENVVEVYIGYLRKKLDGSGRTSLIETVRGVGYRMG